MEPGRRERTIVRVVLGMLKTNAWTIAPPGTSVRNAIVAGAVASTSISHLPNKCDFSKPTYPPPPPTPGAMGTVCQISGGVKLPSMYTPKGLR